MIIIIHYDLYFHSFFLNVHLFHHGNLSKKVGIDASQAVIGFSTVDDMALLNIEGPALVGKKGSAVSATVEPQFSLHVYRSLLFLPFTIMYLVGTSHFSLGSHILRPCFKQCQCCSHRSKLKRTKYLHLH